MKNFMKFLIVAILGIALSGIANAQVTQAANATAIIVSPITIVTNADLVFGNIVNDADGGSVDISTAGARTLNSGLTAVAGAFNAAQFTVTGTDALSFALDLKPDDGDILISDGSGHTMTVNNFSITPIEGDHTFAGATQIVLVGARLTVAAGQTPGSYSSANAGGETFTITVNYN